MRISKNNTGKKAGAGHLSTVSTKPFFLIKSFLIILFFTAITLAIYANTFNSPFLLDDVLRIKENPDIRVTEFSLPQIIAAGFNSSRTRPLAFISFALNHSLHQYEVFGYHLFNISIHILTGFFLYLFLKATFSIPIIQARYEHTDLISFFAALIWLVHPIQTQAVTYIVQRMTGMAAMFFMLSFLFYAHARLAEDNYKRSLWFIAAAVTWLVSLGCKQITAILPFLVFLYEWYFFQDLSKQWFIKSLKYLVAIGALFILLLLIYTGFSPWEKIQGLYDYAQHEFTIMQRLLTQFRVVIYYISLVFFPHPARLNLDYDFPLSHSLIDPFTTLLALLVVIGLMALSIYLARKERLISFCILWFLGNLIIESSVIPLAIIFEHRNYLPSMLLLLIPVIFGHRYIKLNWLKLGFLAIVAVTFCVWTYQRNQVWENEVTLWTDVVAKSPNKARANSNLGLALFKLGRIDEAITQYRKILQIKPDYYQAHVNLGAALEEQEKWDAALAQYRAALRIKPDNHVTHNNVGALLARQGKTNEAIAHYHTALKIEPDYPRAHFNLGSALAEQGNIEQAVEQYQKALKIWPNFTEAHIKLGTLFLNNGQPDKAIAHYKAALLIDPNAVEAYNNLGIALMQDGQIEAAIRQFQRAVQIKPDFILAQNNLKRALSLLKELDTEISRLQELQKENPDNAELTFEIGNLYFRRGDHRQAMQFYKKALQLNPKFVPALNNLALVTAANQEYYKALTIFLDVLNFAPDDVETHYNIACMYSRLRRVDESIEWLKKALDMGYVNWENIKKDSDLDNIRNSYAYRELVKNHWKPK